MFVRVHIYSKVKMLLCLLSHPTYIFLFARYIVRILTSDFKSSEVYSAQAILLFCDNDVHPLIQRSDWYNFNSHSTSFFVLIVEH